MSTQAVEEIMAIQAMNPDKKEAFAQRMVGILNDSSLALMMSIGHQTGFSTQWPSCPPLQANKLPKRPS